MANIRSRFLIVVSAVLVASFLAVAAFFLGTLGALNDTTADFQEAFVSLLEEQMEEAVSSEMFSGTLYNVSDSLLNDEVLVELGAREEMGYDEVVQAAEELLASVVEQASGATTNRYFYFAASDYLMVADCPGEDGKAAVSETVLQVVAALAEEEGSLTGDFANHLGTDDSGNYSVIVRTVAPGVYYVSYFANYSINPFSEDEALEILEVFLYDEYGNAIATTDSAALIGAYTYDTLGDADTGVAYCEVGGQHYVGVYATSYTRGFRMAAFTVDVAAETRDFIVAMLVACLLVLLAALVVVYLAMRQAHRPFAALARRMDAQSPDEGHRKAFLYDEGAVITHALDAYDQTLSAQHDLLRESWVRRTVHGASTEELAGYEDEWVVSLDGRLFTVVVCMTSGGGRKDVEDFIAEAFECKGIDDDGMAAIIVLLAGTRGRDRLIARLKQLQEERPELELSALVGSQRTDLSELSESYEEAKRAAEHCLAQEMYGVVAGHEEVVDARAEGGIETAGLEALSRCARAIAERRPDEALRRFDEFARTVQASDSPDYALAVAENVLAMAFANLPDAEKKGFDQVATGLSGAKSMTALRKQLASALRGLTDTEKRALGEEDYERIAAYVKDNFRDGNMSAGALARRFGMSQSSITRLFKKYHGTTFLEYLHRLRLNEAKKLLRETDLRETDIAERVGYNNSVTMIRAFKNYEGVTPSDIRRQSER